MSEVGEDSESFHRFRDFHEKSMLTIEEIRLRLQANDDRLTRLESDGEPHSRKTWNDTVTDSDLLVAAVAAVELAHLPHGIDHEEPPHIQEVLDRFPGITHDTLLRMAHADEPTKTGFVSFLQGFYGEQVAVDLINHGSIPVPDGYHAVLNGSTNAEAYDLHLVNEHGDTMAAQVKISESGAAVHEHLVRYPDVRVVYTNTEAAHQLARDHAMAVIHPGDAFPEDAHTVVVDMGVSQDRIRHDMMDFVNHGDHAGTVHDFWRKLPVVSLLLIAGSTIRAYSTTDEPQRDIFLRAGRRVRDVFTAQGLGHGLDFFVPGDSSGILSSVYLVAVNGFRIARGNFVRSTELAHASRTYLSAF
ncbi:MAG: hypothetical protein RLZZ526_1504 [Actinomycetota bacterium]